VDSTSRFRVFVNVVKVAKANATAYDYRTRQWVTFPMYLPVGYRLERAGENVVYQIYLNVTRCRNATLPRGEPAVLYEIELRHSLDQLPWLEVYAAVPHNITQYYSWLYGYYTAWRRPPAVGLTPSVGADEGLWSWSRPSGPPSTTPPATPPSCTSPRRRRRFMSCS
jgi:hypothetical protein